MSSKKQQPAYHSKRMTLESFEVLCQETKQKLENDSTFLDHILKKEQNTHYQKSYIRKLYEIGIAAKLCQEKNYLDGCTKIYEMIHGKQVRITTEKSEELTPYRTCLYKKVVDTLKVLIVTKEQQQPPQPQVQTKVVSIKKNVSQQKATQGNLFSKEGQARKGM